MLDKEEVNSPHLEELMGHYHSIISLLGEDAQREGLLKTPERVAKAMLTLTKGYTMNPHEVLSSAKFKDCERHRLLLALRTPHVAFLRQSACGLYSQRIHYGIEQDCPCGRHLFSPFAGAGTHDSSNKRMYSANTKPARGDGRC